MQGMHPPLPGDGPHIPFQPAARYPDPAVESLHPSFAALRLYSASVEQLASGCRWAEGPVWLGDTRALVWSDSFGYQGAHQDFASLWQTLRVELAARVPAGRIQALDQALQRAASSRSADDGRRLYQAVWALRQAG